MPIKHVTHCLDSVPLSGAYFGQGLNDIVLDELVCVGNEAALQDCPSEASHDCNHSEDAGVRCNRKL